jgi:hypothetical protein
MKHTTTSSAELTHASTAQASGDGKVDRATLELLAAWRAEDATTDPEEIRAAADELAEFKRSMNESRVSAGEPPLYP